MRASDAREVEILALIHNYLLSGPWHRAAAALERDVAEAGVLPLTPGTPASLATMRCPPDQLRRLLARAHAPGHGTLLSTQAAGDSAAAHRRLLPLAPPLPAWLGAREMHGGRGMRSSAPGRRVQATALGLRTTSELLAGSERLGLRGVLDGHTNAAYCVAFDANCERIFTGADDHLIKVWDCATCFLLRTLRGHRAEITDISVHASGTLLASACNDQTIRVWALDVEGCPCIAVLQPPAGMAPGVDASPPIVARWRPLSTFRPNPEVFGVTQKGQCLLWTRLPPPPPPSASAQQPQRPQRPQRARTRRRPGEEGEAAEDTAVPHVSLRLAPPAAPATAPAEPGGRTAPIVHGWRLESSQLPRKASAASGAQGDNYSVYHAAWSAGGVRVAICTSDDVIHVLRVAEPRAAGSAPVHGALSQRPSTAPVHGALAAAAQAAAPAASASAAAVEAPPGPVLVATLRGHKNDVLTLAWASDGLRLATASKDGSARLWKLKGTEHKSKGAVLSTGRVLGETRGVGAEKWGSTTLGKPPPEGSEVPQVVSVVWTCDDALLLTSSSLGHLSVWCGHTGVAVRSLRASGPAAPPSRALLELRDLAAAVPPSVTMTMAVAMGSGAAGGGSGGVAAADGGPTSVPPPTPTRFMSSRRTRRCLASPSRPRTMARLSCGT
jgi:WD40 repeat protein